MNHFVVVGDTVDRAVAANANVFARVRTRNRHRHKRRAHFLVLPHLTFFVQTKMQKQEESVNFLHSVFFFTPKCVLLLQWRFHATILAIESMRRFRI